MKKLALVSGIVLLGAATLGGGVMLIEKAPPTSEARIEKEQDDVVKATGKYKQEAKKDGREIHEYVSKDGPGYQVFEEEVRADGTYQRSYGKGPEAESRSFDWVRIQEQLPATTTTK